jgi:hypothetical protein
LCSPRSLVIDNGLLTSQMSYLLIKYAIVAYVRPFMNCKGISKPNWQLRESKYLPRASRDDHSLIISHRKQIIAHSDVTFDTPGWPDSPRNEISSFGITRAARKETANGLVSKYSEDLLTLVPILKRISTEVRDELSVRLKKAMQTLQSMP